MSNTWPCRDADERMRTRLTPRRALLVWNATSRRLVAGETAGSSPPEHVGRRLPLLATAELKQKSAPATTGSARRLSLRVSESLRLARCG
jgi:hypothetical protein